VCRPDDWFDAVRAAGGVDVIIDPVGGEVLEQSVMCLAPEGRLVTVGAASLGPGQIASAGLMRRSCTVMGLHWLEMLERDPGLFVRTAKQLDELFANGLRPIITRTYELAEGADALRALEDRTASGKLVIATR
jgi:NADPH2:quinone reductase